MENALDLHADSVHLFRRRSYGSALTLSILAAEEIGKYCIVADVVFHSDVNGPWTAEQKEEYLKDAFDHRRKQARFGSIAERILPRQVLEHIWSGRLEQEKQKGVYVGLPRRRKGIDLGGRLSAPRHIGRIRAERQITAVNDCLLTLCVGCAGDVYLLDIAEVHEGLSLAVARRLNRAWPKIGPEARRFIRQVNPTWFKARARAGMPPGDGA